MTSEKTNYSGQTDTLRQRAEEKLKAGIASPQKVISLNEVNLLLHELQVHQIELEMQNEELQHSQVEMAASQSRYQDLYELAPVGYLTMNEKGVVLAANLTAAKLLGVVRSALIMQPFSRFIIKEDYDNFYLQRKALLATRTQQAWETRMLRADGSSFWAHLEATVLGDGESQSTP